MKAEELQVGDWVSSFNQQWKVYSIHWGEIIGIINSEGSETKMSSLIEPIPLTPEILEKNGFKSNVECYDKIGWDWGDEFIYAFVFKHDSGRFVVDCGGKCEGHYVGFIDSVHELQHALKLCKIEKEITL